MKRFFLFFLFFTFYTFAIGQNLIPNPSAEDYIECPEHLGGWPEDGNGIDRYAPPWESYRGTPDYFNSCSESPFLGWNNSLGYQEPRTGEGYLGAIPFHQNLGNAREYFGVELLEALVIGETYTVSFYVSLAFRTNVTERAINNLGFLLLETNTLDSAEQGQIPNNATYSVNEIIDDTTNWVQITSTLVADSAYQFIAFGNFFNDSTTSIEDTNPEGIGVIAYYYFDDFCLSSGDICDFTNNVDDILKIEVNVFPNPATRIINIKSTTGVELLQVYNSQGQLLKDVVVNNQLELKIDLDFESGIYLAKIKTEKGYTTKRFMVQ